MVIKYLLYPRAYGYSLTVNTFQIIETTVDKESSSEKNSKRA